jgi:hypothetical protein
MAGALRAARTSKLLMSAVLATLSVLVAVTSAEATGRAKDRNHTGRAHVAGKHHAKLHWRARVKAARARHARDKAAPTAHKALTANPGDGQVKLAWGASTDNVAVNGYRVYRGGSAVASVNASTLSWTDAGLVDGTTYSYTVKAVDGAGNWSPSSNTATATPVGSITPTPPPTTPPPGGDPSGPAPSGQALPVGDIPGWHQIFSDDFPTNVPSGAGVASGGQAGYFPQAVSSKWSAYPWPWTGTPTWANYFPERTTSIHDGLMDMWMHTETINGVSKHLIDAVEPRVNGAGSQPYLNGGRWVIRFKSDTFAGYHASYLLWPQWDDTGQQSWPGSGEIDFPEGNYNSSIDGFVHYQDGSSGGDQAAISTGTPMSGTWHTAVIEWKPGQVVNFILDGRTVGTVTSRVPVSPMRWVIQSGGAGGTPPADSANGHVYVDWVAVYRPA